ncbi:SNF2 family N-terminal domain-containing protein [Lentinula lateritia]|uniref:SNF2 family N-terminal domain-containing protein n=1 Tax=Lentinula aff. lateritia TaxID=2804960 RepID=A0ACC1TKM1_9AGAR|nr:SNF2 family N-terminal domain-containing protein [Lentinula aff. lateritia]KAJ3847544.1 SNF2 family N-terminal domain-containing protein [Lentinula lateritia]
MSSSDIPLKLAGMHLGLPDDASLDLIPHEYLTELSKHLAIYPDDTKFELSRQPNHGFGKVTCLEDGCDRFQIELQHNPTLFDGGRKIGIGSLSTYRPSSRKRSMVKNEPVAADLHTIRVPLSSSPDLPHRTLSLHQPRLSLIKAEPKEYVFEGSSNSSPSAAFRSSSPGIRKRSPSLDTNNLDFLPSPMRSSGSIFPPSKKLKTEPTSRAPLGVSTNMAIVAPTGVIPHTALGVDDIQGQIDNLQTEIFLKQDILDGLLRQDSRTPAKLMLIQKYVDELTSLDLLQGEFRSHLPGESSPFMSKVGPHHSFGEHGEIGHSALPWYAHTAQAPSGSFATSATARNHSIPEPVPTPLATIPVTINSDRVPPCVPPPLQVNAVAGPSKHAQQPAYISGHILHNYEDEAGDAEMGYASPNETAKANEVAMQFAGTYIPNVAPIVQDDHEYDGDGNFRGRGKDHFQGPIAKPDDIDKFLVEAGNSESFDHNATVEAALNKLGLPTLATPLPGMEVALMPHQVIGVAWMLEKENSNLKGGCLADEMGLGKTVQMIALIMKNRPDDKSRRTTLILAPTALLDQWKMEIEVKTNIGLKVLIYHGSSKLKRAKDLHKYDVVLTTFQTMALEWPDIEQEEKKKKKAMAKKDDPIMSDSVNENTLKKDKSQEGKLSNFLLIHDLTSGLLFQIEFFRIVLDEAQGIKNKKTRVSRAVTALKARYRWCLTGTPIINGLSDTYPYIRFLQIRPWHDFVEFHRLVGKLERKNPQLAITRLQAILNIFVLRRKKNSKLDGKVLIDLPTKEITLRRLEFTEEEREIYDAVEKRMQTQFNRFLKAVLLLRLRQCCAHPSLIQEDGVAFVAPDELDDAGRVLKRARESVSVEFVTKLKTKFREAVLERMRAEKESEDATFETDDCPICYDNFTNAVITSCGHSFCKECIHDVFNAPLVVPANEAGPACRTPISKELLFEQIAFMPTDEELKEAGGQGEDSDIEMDDVDVTISKGKGRAKVTSSRSSRKVKRSLVSYDGIDEEDEDEYDDDDMSDFIVESDDEEEEDVRKALTKCIGKRQARVILDSDEEESDEEKEVIFGKNNVKKLSPEAIKLLPRFLPSTKMKYMMEHIRQLFLDRPEEKARPPDYLQCMENHILHVKYQGDMNRNKRDAAVRSFMSKDKARVMLLSLKCGGVGLNLTRANNVISLDLGWSQAIEDQAFDRVHRLGQLLPVKVHRLVVDRTIEHRMLVMQERKQMLADGSLGEGTAKKIRRMTVKQLAELFGLDGCGRLLNNGKAKDIAKVEINNAHA